MSHGLSFKFNYAWSKPLDTGSGAGYLEGIDVCQNAYDIGSNYGLSNSDTPFTLTGSFTYEIPVGVNRTFRVHGPLDAAVGGWRITGVMHLHSGNPPGAHHPAWCPTHILTWLDRRGQRGDCTFDMGPGPI